MEKEKVLMDICSALEETTRWVAGEVSKGKENVNGQELGDAADIVKDLACAKKDYLEAKYYETVIEAMEEGEEPRYGYNSRHYANGEFAPKGRGTRMGFKPFVDQEPYIDAYMRDPNFDRNMVKMGYGNGGGNGGNSGSSGGGMSGGNSSGYSHMNNPMPNSKYGKAFSEYQEAKRHYTATNSLEDKEEMNEHAHEHLNDTISTMREIYKTSDPDLKKRIKADITGLLQEMPNA